MRKILWSFFEVFETLAIAIVAVVLIRSFIAQPFLVSGSSMELSFSNGDYLLVDELVYRFREPQRGEVIVFKNPTDSGSYFVKRIIGLPGERIMIDESQVSIYSDGSYEIIKEDYAQSQKKPEMQEISLADGEYFVMGDNRSFSYDSRSWGPLSDENIIGLVRLRLWPLNRVMAIGAPEY